MRGDIYIGEKKEKNKGGLVVRIGVGVGRRRKIAGKEIFFLRRLLAR